MKKRTILLAAVSLLIARPGLAAEAPLQVAGAIARPAALQLRDLEAMQPLRTTWKVGDESRTVLGVPLDKLLERQGLSPGRMGDDGQEKGKGWRRVVVASAPDGFQAVFSVAELTPHLGATRALIAWKIDDKPLPADRGPLRLVVLTDKVASRSVHSVNRLEVVELGTGAAPPDPLARVSDIHGAAGPFAVAGFRMGQRALRELGLPAGSFDLEVRHESPAEVQWSCIADGAQAATGASAGKLNLQLREAARERMRTVFRRKSTGKTLVFQLKPSFAKRFLDLPRAALTRTGAEVMALPDEEIFSVERP
jgi:formylmethanofuran dehydrogenase subunit E